MKKTNLNIFQKTLLDNIKEDFASYYDLFNDKKDINLSVFGDSEIKERMFDTIVNKETMLNCFHTIVADKILSGHASSNDLKEKAEKINNILNKVNSSKTR